MSALIAALIASKVLHLRANFGRLFIYLMVAAYVTPITVFGVFNASVRIPTFAAILLVAGLALSDRLQRWRAPSLVLIAILLGIKLALINLVLSKGSAEVSEFREAAKVISAGNRVATVVFDRSNRNFSGSTSGKPVNWDRFQNLDSYLIVDRQAFVPNIFGVLGTDYQPEYKEHTRPLGKPVPQQLLLIEWKQWPEPYKSRDQFMRDWRNAYDYILSIDLGHRPQLPAGVTVLHTGSYFQILKVAKGG